MTFTDGSLWPTFGPAATSSMPLNSLMQVTGAGNSRWTTSRPLTPSEAAWGSWLPWEGAAEGDLSKANNNTRPKQG